MSETKLVEFKDAEKALLDTGLLWALNTLILHPTGLAIALSYEGDDVSPNRIILMMTDDGEHIQFDAQTDEEGRNKLARFILDRLALNMPLPNEPLLSHMAWPPPSGNPPINHPSKISAIVFLGEMVRQLVLAQMRDMKTRWGREVTDDDIVCIQVPHWLHNALAAVQETDLPKILGKPLMIGITPAESVVVTFRES